MDEVFSTWSHIAVLRALQDSGQGLTGREVARLSNMNHRSCLAALTALEALSLVRRQRGGRDHLFSLNRDHKLVHEGILPLLALEREFFKSMLNLLTQRLARRVKSAIVFGSVARREETAVSDLDICLVVRTKADKEKVQAIVHDIAPSLLRQYGAKLAPLILTAKEFSGRAKKGRPPVNEILKEGTVITGKSLKGLVGGKE
jgi:predicted nucleotidyltransferase